MFITGACERWHALQVRSNHERKVAKCLRELGQEEFLPLLHSDNKSSQVQRTELPLFPGYVFCKIDWQNGPRLYHVAGIIRVVGTGKTPIPIDDGEIEAIKRVVGSSFEYRPCEVLRHGTAVEIACGPLAGIRGTVLEPRSRQLVVSVSLMRRSVAVTIDPDQLTTLPTSNPDATNAA